MVNVLIFNYVHLRLRSESVTVLCLLYYLPYKIILTFVNIASCYYSIYKYATYFAKRHPKVIEDDKAVAVVLRLEEEAYSASERAAIATGRQSGDGASLRPRRFTITAVGTNLSSVAQAPLLDGATENIEVVDFATQAAPQLEPVPEGKASSESRFSSSTLGQMPPPMPAPRRRPFSWHRSTSKNSSDSNVSPFDERQKYQFPLPSPEALSNGRSPDENRATLTRRPSPVYFRSLTSSIRQRASSNQAVSQARLPTGAPELHPALRRPPSAPSSRSSHRMSSISRNSSLSFRFPSPPTYLGSPVTSLETRGFVVISPVQNNDGDWPLRTPRQPVTHRYISALADTGNAGWTGRPRGRLFITEDDSEDEEML